MSSHERRQLDELPKRIAQLDASAGKLRALLADTELYARDPAGFAKATETLAQIEAAITKAEDDWLALEMKREAVEG